MLIIDCIFFKGESMPSVVSYMFFIQKIMTFYRLNIDTNDHEDNVSLCQCAVIALRELFLNSKLPLVHELLIKEKAVSLSQVNSS